MQSEMSARIFGDTEDPRRRLEAMFGGEAGEACPPPAAREWARRMLARAEIDPSVSETAAILCLRNAQPRLTLKAAAYLAKDATRA